MPVRTENDIVRVVFHRLFDDIVNGEPDERHDLRLHSHRNEPFRKGFQPVVRCRQAFRGLQNRGSGRDNVHRRPYRNVGGHGLDNVQEYDPRSQLLGKLGSLVDDRRRGVTEIDWNKQSFHDRSGDNNFAATRRGRQYPNANPGKFCAVFWQQREDGAATMTMR